MTDKQLRKMKRAYDKGFRRGFQEGESKQAILELQGRDRFVNGLRLDEDSLRAEIKRLRAALEEELVDGHKLQASVVDLEDALNWYAVEAWEVDGGGRRPIDSDHGSRAAKGLRENV